MSHRCLSHTLSLSLVALTSQPDGTKSLAATPGTMSPLDKDRADALLYARLLGFCFRRTLVALGDARFVQLLATRACSRPASQSTARKRKRFPTRRDDVITLTVDAQSFFHRAGRRKKRVAHFSRRVVVAHPGAAEEGGRGGCRSLTSIAEASFADAGDGHDGVVVVAASLPVRCAVRACVLRAHHGPPPRRKVLVELLSHPRETGPFLPLAAPAASLSL